jgi:hypothetical protein
MAEEAKTSVVEMKDDSRFRANTSLVICKVWLTVAAIADGFHGMCLHRESDIHCKAGYALQLREIAESRDSGDCRQLSSSSPGAYSHHLSGGR